MKGKHKIQVGDPPKSADERLALFDEFIKFMGEDYNYLKAEKSFAKWIYSSGRLDSSFWNKANGHLLMTMIAAMAASQLSSSEQAGLQPDIQVWLKFIKNPTAGNFWNAHGFVLREGMGIYSYSNETINEQVFTTKALDNVLTLGDDCAAGSQWSCGLANNTNILLTTRLNYPQEYPASSESALMAMQYDGNMIHTGIYYFYSFVTGCVGTSVCYTSTP